MKLKKLLSFASAMAMAATALLGTVPLSASAATAGNLTYEVSNGVLTISGNGAMDNYASGNRAPWYGYRNSIRKVVIESGVTSIGNYAFQNYYSNITEVEMADTVKSIGDYAFQYASALTTVTISDNLTSIGNYAFDISNSKLTTLQTTVTTTTPDPDGGDDIVTNVKGLPSKLQTIGDYAFRGNQLLEGITSFPSTVTSIGSYAFNNCYKAFDSNSTMQINASTIGTYAFQNCRSLKGILLQGNVTTVPDYAFDGCTGLTNVAAFANLTTIGNYAFRGCTSLTSDIWNNIYQSGRGKLSRIGNYAFDGCTSLTTVGPFVSSLNTVGNYAFRGCTGITSVNVPSSWTSIGDSVFQNCTSLAEATLPDNMTAIPSGMFSGTAIEKIKIPSGVTSIGTLAFNNCESLETVEFTSYKLESIGASAFSGCTSLTSLMLPSTVKTIGMAAFSDSGLTSFAIPTAVTEIPAQVFENCESLESVEFSDNVTSMGNNVFKGCTSLRTVTLPKNLETVTGRTFAGSSIQKIIANPESETFASDSNGVLYNVDMTTLVAYPSGRTNSSFSIPSTVTTIGDYAFYQNTKLTSVTIGSNVETIGNSAFYGLTALRTATIPVKVKSIGSYAYQSCTALTTLTFTNAATTSTCETIGASAFSGCTALTAVTTPNSMKSIGDNAFINCTALATVTLNNGLESIGQQAFKASGIKAIIFPNTVTTVGQKVFENCKSLTSAKLSKGMTEFPHSMLSGCTALTSVQIPSGIEKFGPYAFYGCTSLEEVIIPNTVDTIDQQMFYNCSSLKKVVMSSNVTKIPANAFFGCNDPDLKIYLLGTITTHTVANSFGSAAANYVKGTIYVYDDASYTKLLTSNAVKNAGNAKLAYAADFTELKETIAEAGTLNLKNYTAASVSVVESNLALAESVIANYASTQGQADAAVKALKDSISKLVEADPDEALLELEEAIAAAEELIESDYNPESYAVLTAAVKAGENVSADALPGDILDLADAINEAIDNLIPSYAYTDTIKEIKSNDYAGGTFLSGTATAGMAGATQVKVTFDMSEKCAFNQMTEFNFKPSINGVDGVDQKAVGSGWPANGTKGHTGTFNLPAALEEGDAYNFVAYTYNWSGVVFIVRSVELLNADGEVVFSTKNPPIPNEDLIAAVETAKTADTTDWSEEYIDMLSAAIEYAESVIAAELPLPSELDAAKDMVSKAALGPKAPADYSALDEALDNVPADLSKYTDESVKALNDVLNSIDKNLTIADQDKIDEYVEAVNDAIANLAEKPSQPSSDPSSEPSSDPSSEPSSNITKTPTASTTATPVKTTRDAKVVAADKAAAEKVMKQAKIKKLTVKSKAKKKITVTWKKVKKAVGYEVQVSTNKKFKNSKIVLTKTTAKKKLVIKNKKIKSGKKYFVRVRAYATYQDANNKAVKVYSAWNKKLRTVKVK